MFAPFLTEKNGGLHSSPFTNVTRTVTCHMLVTWNKRKMIVFFVFYSILHYFDPFSKVERLRVGAPLGGNS